MACLSAQPSMRDQNQSSYSIYFQNIWKQFDTVTYKGSCCPLEMVAVKHVTTKVLHVCPGDTSYTSPWMLDSFNTSGGRTIGDFKYWDVILFEISIYPTQPHRVHFHNHSQFYSPIRWKSFVACIHIEYYPISIRYCSYYYLHRSEWR